MLRDSSSSLSLGGAFFHILRHWLNSHENTICKLKGLCASQPALYTLDASARDLGTLGSEARRAGTSNALRGILCRAFGAHFNVILLPASRPGLFTAGPSGLVCPLSPLKSLRSLWFHRRPRFCGYRSMWNTCCKSTLTGLSSEFVGMMSLMWAHHFRQISVSAMACHFRSSSSST